MKRILNSLISSKSRSAVAGRNSLYMIIIKGISIYISFLYVPLLLNTFDETNYGIWLTLTSLVSWIALFDIGIGNGLRNTLTKALADNNNYLARTIVSTAYIAMFAVICILYLSFLCLYKFINWNSILVGSPEIIPKLNLIVLIVFSGFILQFFIGLINSILFAVQKPAISSLSITIGQLISYLLVLLSVQYFKHSSMLELGSIISFTPPIILLVTSIILFNTTLKHLRPSFKYFEFSKIGILFSLGVQFFIIQIITIVLFQSNNLIITHVINSGIVVEYNIAYKYMNILVIVFNIIATPIWSATTDAWQKNDIEWIILTNRRLLKLSLVFTIVGLLMLIISPYVYKLWIRDEIRISTGTTLLLLLYSSLMMVYGSYGYILNGIGKLRVQTIATALIAIAYIPMACVLGRYYGLTGILSAFAVTSAINVIWSRMQYNKLIKGTASGIWKK